MKNLLLILATTLLASSANAQSAFEGFYGQLSTGYENNSISKNAINQSCCGSYSSSTTSGSLNQSSAPLIVGLGYVTSITSSFVVGLGLDYSALSTTTNTIQLNTSQTQQNPNYKISNRFNVYFTQGFVLDLNRLIYVKAGYSSQTVHASDSNASSIFTGGLGSSNVSGHILGLGYKQMVSGGLYLFGEGNYLKYQTADLNSSHSTNNNLFAINSSPSSSAYNFLVGIGYKF